MSQKLPVNNFEWIKDFSQFNENFIESYNKEIDERYFLEVDVQYPKIIYELQYIQQSFSKNIWNKNEKKKTEVLTNKPVYLGLLILDLSNILMYQFCYDYLK